MTVCRLELSTRIFKDEKWIFFASEIGVLKTVGYKCVFNVFIMANKKSTALKNSLRQCMGEEKKVSWYLLFKLYFII